MSRPADIVFTLGNWLIRYDPMDYEGVYEASVTWKSTHEGVKPVRKHKNFHNRKEAMEWIEKETELKYE